jgi:hypothetical protein
MAKSSLIIVRVDPQLKQRFEAAARRRGQSLSTFMLKAAEDAAGKVEAMNPAALLKPKGKSACPSFFLALCLEAKQGGENGYYAAGHELTRHVSRLVDFDNDEEAEKHLDELYGLIEAGEDDAVIGWFEKWLPRCMKLVPRRRRGSFLRGVYDMIDEEPDVFSL